MISIMDKFRKVVNNFKTKLSNEKNVESVSIRVESIPDWLYKITIKDVSDLREKGIDFYKSINHVRTNISKISDSLKFRDLLNMSISRYRYESIMKSKEKLIEKISSFLINTEFQPESIEDYREFSKIVLSEIKLLRVEIKKYERSIGEYFNNDFIKLNNEINSINEIMLKFSSSFVKTNDDKVDDIIAQTKKINETIKNIELKEVDLKKVDNEIEKIRSRIYGLSEKISEIKRSPRFVEILEKEEKLSRLINEKDDLLEKLSRGLSKIEIILFNQAEKEREEELIKEYINHLPRAMEHDKKNKINNILQKLLDDLNSKKTKLSKDLGDEKRTEFLGKVNNLINLFKVSSEKIKEIDKKIATIKSRLKNYNILNDLDDKEGRIKFYQNSLNEVLLDRDLVLKEISTYNLAEQKERLRKDLLIYTGYDVNVIYEPKKSTSK